YFTWCCREGLIPANPAINTNKAAETARSRTLSPEELRLIWMHAGDDHYGAILRLLALTGARANEIASLAWSEVHGDTVVLAADRVKNKRGHEIFLTAIARQIIEAQPRRVNAAGLPRDLIFGQGEGGFTGWSKSKDRLDARIAEATGKPLPAWVPHDLRRCFSTYANELGLAPPHIIEARMPQQRFPTGHPKTLQLGELSERAARIASTLVRPATRLGRGGTRQRRDTPSMKSCAPTSAAMAKSSPTSSTLWTTLQLECSSR